MTVGHNILKNMRLSSTSLLSTFTFKHLNQMIFSIRGLCRRLWDEFIYLFFSLATVIKIKLILNTSRKIKFMIFEMQDQLIHLALWHLFWLVRLFVFLFDGILTSVDYLILKPSLLNSSDNIQLGWILIPYFSQSNKSRSEYNCLTGVRNHLLREFSPTR